MNEDDLIALLTGERTEPIPVCSIPYEQAICIGAYTTTVFLSRENLTKHEVKRPDKNLSLYLTASDIITSGYVLVAPPKNLIYIRHYKEPDKTRSYKAVVKATQAGHELFLLSIHRVDRTSVRAAFRRGTRLTEWRRRERHEVGPPKNPT